MVDLNELVQVTLPDPDKFLLIKETLTRIGIVSVKNKSLTQSCHILHKQGKYYITHFKEMFMLDGKEADFSESDKARRNTIVNMLEKWGLVKIVNPDQTKDTVVAESSIKVLAYADKKNYELISKYQIGNVKKDING